MASFNLGRIKGDKGDPGDRGPKGDTGLKGEKGDKGDNGRDGMTPVFSIGETATLSSSEEARVELDYEDSQNPVLSFYIPRGKDGKDAMGDMIKRVYDTQGIGTDIYEYARNLVDSCVKISGGTLSGALRAAESAVSEGAVRNISVRSDLPQSGADGDICIILSDANSKKLGECNPGDIMIIKENDADTQYIVTAKDYHADNSVTLVRKYLYPVQSCYKCSTIGKYFMSDIDVFLETIYRNTLPDRIKNSLMSIEIIRNIYRHCFLLDRSDLDNMDYFDSNIVANVKGIGTAVYITRDINSQGKVTSVTASGTFASVPHDRENYFRPTIVLPADLSVVNIDEGDTPTVSLHTTSCGIYVCLKGEWKECALI